MCGDIFQEFYSAYSEDTEDLQDTGTERGYARKDHHIDHWWHAQFCSGMVSRNILYVNPFSLYDFIKWTMHHFLDPATR